MTTDQLTIRIDHDGTLHFVYDDALVALCEAGDTTITRVSHVEPATGGGWHADMGPVAGPVLGPFPTRGAALAAERQWLAEHRGL